MTEEKDWSGQLEGKWEASPSVSDLEAKPAGNRSLKMGGATKLRFPLPHRRSKQQSQEVHSISSPMTNKAQKFLGNAEININPPSPSSPAEPFKTWETRSAVSGVSGISVTVSEASGTTSAFGGSTVTAGSRGNPKAAWDQESDIIPKGLGITGSVGPRGQALDVTTDASSLRRRGSSSTIVSYYDKSKLPLSISQQTSNSAMAKGLPNKAAELLDMESPRAAPSPPVASRKKPGKLDLSHLLPTMGSSSRFSRFAHKGSMVLGSDMLTRSPSFMSTSSAVSPSGSESKPFKGLRRKLTKESLRSLHTSRPERLNSWSAETGSAEPSSPILRKRASDTGNLLLYKHYEQTSFRDTVDYDEPALVPSVQTDDHNAEPDSLADPRRTSRQSASTSSPSSNRPRHHASPSFGSVSWRPHCGYSPDEDCGPIAENPRVSVTSSNLASPPGEYAGSVSSRHTRTSRASRMTGSFADFDPNAVSVLSLSSDSEDDYPDPPRTGTSAPSVGSRDSVFSAVEPRRPSNTSISQESMRSQPKSKFRASLSPQAPFLAIPEHEKGPNPAPPPINPRSSSLGSAVTTNTSPRPSMSNTVSSARSPSRLSQVSVSTADSIQAHFSRPRPGGSVSGQRQPSEVRHVAMLQTLSSTPAQKRPEPIPEKPQASPRTQMAAAAKSSQPTPPLSPSSMEFVIRGEYDTAEHEGPALTLSGTDTAGHERFIAVTRQEEMLLAAMRAKRALMRDNLQIADVDDLDHETKKKDKAAGKKESVSSTKTVAASSLMPLPLNPVPSHGRSGSKGNSTTLRFPEPPSSTKNSRQSEYLKEARSDEKHEQALMCLNRNTSTKSPYDLAEPSPDLSDFIVDFDAQQFPAPPIKLQENVTHSRNSSTNSATTRLSHPKPARHHRQSSFGRPRPDTESMPKMKPSPAGPLPPVPTYRGVDLDAVPGSRGGRSASKERRTKQVAFDIVRANSPAMIHEEDAFVELPQAPLPRKKAVRISAVGLSLPEIEQWGDDG